MSLPPSHWRGIALEKVELIRMLQQGQGAVAQEVDGGLVTSNDEQDEHRDQLMFAELIPTNKLTIPSRRAEADH